MKKMSVIASSGLDNDEDLHLTDRQWDAMRKNIRKQNASDDEEVSESDEDKDEQSSDEEDDDSLLDEESEDEDGSDVDSDESVDDKVMRVNAMAEQMESQIKAQKEYQMVQDRREAKKE